ncbi:MAG: carbohydrate-binding protein [Hamadaea sp.]|uniref:glycoside hydrolase family 88 protein n=1 Tax=Hamadaea sp. TaxID=2024425 RepID=UPI001837AB30|nr:glycoside hydrolase family 88 protein [Hamadaea sp.]NUR73595.1 carbohydrate-binding protein [Hamadaea sp.]NUT20844.1 carbohydrate-binding protein [Hamadaea sp.]
MRFVRRFVSASVSIVLVATSFAALGAPASAATTRYEAEAATISQGVVEANHLGYSGTGFVNYDNVTGSSVQWSVDAAAATPVKLVLRYANGTTTNRPMTITLNGQPIVTDAAFPGTGSWDAWQSMTIPVTLATGGNLVKATATTANGGPNVDFLDVDATAPPQVLEAENATFVVGCVVESNWPGYTGTGFANCDNVTGSGVEWTVTAQQAGPTNLTVRYANGNTTNRPAALAVNGTIVGTPVFGPTGAWSAWQSVTVQATLNAGTNVVRLTATTASGPANLDSLTVGGDPGPPSGTDWAVAMVESTMARYTPGTIGGWSYPVGLYMYGQYLVYLRTGDRRYFDYIKNWMDRFVDSSGNVSQSYSNLDSMLPGRVLLILYRETGQAKYRIAAQKIHDRFATYPRTSDGGFWHATSDSRAGQLWADGAFMSMPFLAEYGKVVGDSTYAWDEATKQIVVYASHLQQPSGLLKHAYDEPRDETWSDNVTGLSPEYWCRAIGWFGMATLQILDVLPPDHPRRAQLITIAQNMVRGFATYQDPASGRWFQVVDKGTRSDNWTETSCSSMYAYTIDKAVADGYVAATYQSNADRGVTGVLNRISLGSDGRTNLTDISIGTNVGDYAYYVGRTRATNDFHGLGAFLIMYEQTRT